jgi:outer membrane protein TolC
VRSALARIAQADAVASAANAAYLPQLSAEIAYLHGDTPSAYLFTRIDARQLPSKVDFNDPGVFSNLGGALALRWNLWNGGRDQLSAWAAAAGAEGAAASADAVRNTLAAAVAGVWLDARAAAAGLLADDATIRTLESQTDATRVQVDGGAALRTDLLSIEVRLAEANTARLHTQTAERLALAALRELLALPADVSLAVSNAGPVIDPLPADRGAGLARAYATRPEGAVARRAVEQAELELAAARRAWLPRLDVQSRLSAEAAEAHLPPVDPNWLLGVALSINLFDGGIRRANVQRALAALDLVTEADRATLVRIAREVEAAYLRLDEARARLAVVTRALALAEETLELVTTQYRGGAVTVTRYLEAEGALARARAAHVHSTLDVARAEVEAARAIGALTTGPMVGGSA